MATSQKSVLERAVDIAKVQQAEIERRVVEILKAQGFPGWEVQTTQAQMLDYYRAQFFTPDGQLNPAAIQATIGRVGAKGYADIVKAMGEDFKGQLKENVH